MPFGENWETYDDDYDPYEDERDDYREDEIIWDDSNDEFYQYPAPTALEWVKWWLYRRIVYPIRSRIVNRFVRCEVCHKTLHDCDCTPF